MSRKLSWRRLTPPHLSGGCLWDVDVISVRRLFPSSWSPERPQVLDRVDPILPLLESATDCLHLCVTAKRFAKQLKMHFFRRDRSAWRLNVRWIQVTVIFLLTAPKHLGCLPQNLTEVRVLHRQVLSMSTRSRSSVPI